MALSGLNTEYYPAKSVGGLCGVNLFGPVTRCHARGLVTITNGQFIGGLCGTNVSLYGAAAPITASFWDIQASGMSNSAGGFALTPSQMQDISTFTNAGWDFNSVWKMANYPVFHWQDIYTYAQWAADQGIPSDQRGYQDTPAGDGIPNLLKYACGLDALPCAATDTLYIADTAISNAFSIVFYRSSTATGVRLDPMYSPELIPASWTNTGIDLQLLSTGNKREKWQATIPASATGYMRLRIRIE
jgi:hypothetical protein